MPRYIFNKDTLSYEEIKDPRRYKLTKGALLFIGSVLLSVVYLWLYTSVLGFELPKTVLLQKKNAKLSSDYEVLNKEIDRSALYLASIQLRDNDIYRSIFGMNEIPAEVRNAGFGGVNRYAYLKNIDFSGLLTHTEMRLDILTKKACVQSRSFDEVESVSRKAGSMMACIPSIPPMMPDREIYRISSSFGFRSDPFTGKYKRHTGMDFACKPGNVIRSTADGEVVKVGFDFFGYGNFVIVDHGFGYKTRYAHLSRIAVAEGMKVSRGSMVGESGNSGRSSGPHLHYEVMYRDNYVNPLNFMDLDMTPEEYSEFSDGTVDDNEAGA